MEWCLQSRTDRIVCDENEKLRRPYSFLCTAYKFTGTLVFQPKLFGFLLIIQRGHRRRNAGRGVDKYSWHNLNEMRPLVIYDLARTLKLANSWSEIMIERRRFAKAITCQQAKDCAHEPDLMCTG